MYIYINIYTHVTWVCLKMEYTLRMTSLMPGFFNDYPLKLGVALVSTDMMLLLLLVVGVVKLQFFDRHQPAGHMGNRTTKTRPTFYSL